MGPEAVGQGRRHRGLRRRKPTIAFFSPLPPRKSGVSDYASMLLEALRETYEIDLYHDAGYVPEPVLAAGDFFCADYRLFERIAAVKDYHALVFQMGNSFYHQFLYPILLRHPGVVTLHDFCLAGFHVHYGRRLGRGLGLLREELLRWYPEERERVLSALDTWGNDLDAVIRGCTEREWYLNRSVLDASQVLVVHSPWCAKRVNRSSPENADRVVMIPHGVHAKRPTESQRLATRRRFGIARETLVVGSFGFVHPDKMSPQALDAFAIIAHDRPDVLFLFAGEEDDGGSVRTHAASLGLGDRVRFLGRQPADAFAELIAITDVGVNLRLPPTNGETSGALLNLLASGVATMVTDVATFSDYPEDVVRRVRPDATGENGIEGVLRGLCTDSEARRTLGRSARDYVERHHDWARVSRQYIEAIERCHDELASDGHDPRSAYDGHARGTQPQPQPQPQPYPKANGTKPRVTANSR